MNTMLKVSGMSCEHCVKSVTEALLALSGITDVKVDLAKGDVAVTQDGTVSIEKMKNEIEDLGFDVV